MPLSEQMKAAIKANRFSSSIPVFHNICGQRTTYLPCDCRRCVNAAAYKPELSHD